MKIYYIVSSLDGGGAEFAIPNLVEFFKKAGHTIEVLACIPRNMEIASLLEKHNIKYHLLSTNHSYRYKSTYYLHQFVKRSPPDLIWTSLTRATIDGQLVGLLNHIPVISWKHSANNHFLRLLKLIFLQKLSQFWIADSAAVAHFLKVKMKVDTHRIMVWPLFQNPSNLPVISAWRGEGIFHIGSLGRLHPVKNFDLMIKAIYYINQHYPDVGKRIRLSIAGAGTEEQHLKNLIKSLGLTNVELLGFSEDVVQFLSGLHLYLQTSIYEGLCIAVHEALAVGVPVISTNVGEMQFSIKNHPIGTVLYEDSPKALAKEILGYFYNPTITQQYSANAKHYMAKHYSHECFERAGKSILQRIETEILPRFKKKH